MKISNNKINLEILKNNKNNSNLIKEKTEEIFIKIFLKNMRLSIPKNKLFKENNNEIYYEIYDQKISEILSKRGINLINK
ncbi:hypothetical protein RJD23_01170 [Buchnera aphidicola (Ceratoglyphina bambusae)]|uniref:hypothetical protein n=1 Tax=Buchnera aphidicola TaxID=9 RepID=UPI0031B82A8B